MPSTSFHNVPAEKMLQLVRLLMFSSMSRKERQMWVRLIPAMTEEQIDKLIGVFNKETKANLDLLLDVLVARKKRRGIV